MMAAASREHALGERVSSGAYAPRRLDGLDLFRGVRAPASLKHLRTRPGLRSCLPHPAADASSGATRPGLIEAWATTIAARRIRLFRGVRAPASLKP